MKKLLCALLALLTLCSLLPLGVSAEETGETIPENVPTAEVTVTVHYAKDLTDTYTLTVADEPVTLQDAKYVKTNKRYYELVKYSNGKKTLTIPAYDGTEQWHEDWDKVDVYYKRHSHDYRYRYNRKGHWLVCVCGYTGNVHSHDDPAPLQEKVCTCGYKFSDNCDLVTLWLRNMNLTDRFNKEQTDYTAKVYSYKKVTKTDIRYRTFDAMATVELPGDLTLQEGQTTFQVVVTAEDKTNTKTYTVVAMMPETVDGMVLYSDGTNVTAEPKTTRRKQVYSTTMKETVLAEMAEIAQQQDCKQLVIVPKLNKWYCQQLNVELPCAGLTDAKADLVIETAFATLTVPNADLLALIPDAELLTLSLLKDGTVQILLDGEALADIPSGITAELAPES